MAVIPRQVGGYTASNVVIAWDNCWHDPLTTPTNVPWYQRYTVGDPEVPTSFTNRFVQIPLGPNGLFYGDLFCSGHCWLPDGRLFIAGGNAKYTAGFPSGDAAMSDPDGFFGSRYVGIWDPSAANLAPGYGWNHLAGGSFGKPMRIARWYPTVTLISDHLVMVSGGQSDTRLSQSADPGQDTYELFDLALTPPDWVREPTGEVKLFDGPRGTTATPYWAVLFDYARMHLLSNNKVFVSGMMDLSTAIDPDPQLPTNLVWDWNNPQSGAWSAPLSPGGNRTYGSSVLVPNVGNFPTLRDEIMIVGGEQWQATVLANSKRILAGSSATPPPPWGSTQSLAQPRMLGNAVLAPNGEVVLVGGCTDSYWTASNPTAVLNTEVWSRTAGWQVDAPENSTRMYHSTAVLLPTGHIASAGSDRRTLIPLNQQGPGQFSDWQVYVPRHLNGGQAEPQFAGAWATPGPMSLTWGTTYTIEFSGLGEEATIARVVLMRPCSVTHHSDMDQRYVELTMDPAADGTSFVTVTTPPVPNWSGTAQGSITTPPGYYMAFLVSTNGTTSAAKWVRLS